MRRVETIALALLLTVGCGPAEEQPAPAPPGSANFPAPAQAGSVPDFHSYVLGDLPAAGPVERDPFVDRRDVEPAPAPTPVRRPEPAPALRGVVRSEGRLVALLDTGSGGLGDRVDGWEITAIDARGVTLKRGDRTVRRTL